MGTRCNTIFNSGGVVDHCQAQQSRSCKAHYSCFDISVSALSIFLLLSAHSRKYVRLNLTSGRAFVYFSSLNHAFFLGCVYGVHEDGSRD